MMLMLNVASALAVLSILGSLLYRFTRECFEVDELQFLGPVAIILWLLGGFLLGVLMTQHGAFGSIFAWVGFVPWLGCPIYLITKTRETPNV